MDIAMDASTRSSHIDVLLLCLFAAATGILAITNLQVPGCCITGDTNSYFQYWGNDLFNLRRTPGYPALIVAVSWLTPDLSALLWTQAMIFSLTTPLIYWLLKGFFPDWRVAPILGAAAFALVEHGKIFPYQFLTEAIFTPAAFLSFALFCLGVRRRNASLVLVAAVMSGITILIRPNFSLFILLMPVLAYLLSENLSKRILAWAMGILLAFPVSLAVINHAKFKVFTPSSIAVETAAYYWGAKTLNVVDHPSDTYGMLAQGYRQDMKKAATETGSLDGADSYYRSEIMRIALAYPWAGVAAFGRSLVSNFPKPMSHGALDWLIPTRWSSVLPLNGFCFVLVGWGVYRLYREHDKGLAAALVLYLLFFWGQTGISYWQGGRLVFPLDPFLFSLVACAFAPKQRSGRVDLRDSPIEGHQAGRHLVQRRR